MPKLRTDVTLDDRYTLQSGRIYLTGLQALVRIPLMQRWLDRQANLNTAAFVSGYRGSPLGGLDMAFQSAQKFLDQEHIHFHAGVNEDLAATSVWGSQQLHLGPHQAQYDSVIGLWYGKGPGVDRSLDALKHANAAGSSRHGGVLALAGDDHACKSSSFPHQSEQAFVHAMIPVLYPANIADALTLGLHGIAMSRYSGCWSAFKIVADLADSATSVHSDPFALAFKTPDDFDMPKDGLNIRWYDAPVDQEKRLIEYKLPAAQAYARANGLDRMAIDAPQKRLTIITTGKAYTDTMQALADLDISPARAESLGLSVCKIALTWPLEPENILKLAHASEEFLLIEDKRGVMEDQIKTLLYHLPADQRPKITGKTDENGTPLLPQTYELSPALIAAALVKRLGKETDIGDISTRLKQIEAAVRLKGQTLDQARKPWFCSGCPHNSSTSVPDGSRALAGIGCHYMAMWMERETYMFSQMGGEGVAWIGQSPFTKEEHLFVNLGDGTYFHSGILAIRAAVAAGVNVTYKILFNDAVAMTGGQPVDGNLSVIDVAQQVHAEGVRGVIIVSDAPDKYTSRTNFPTGTRIAGREDLDAIQKDLRRRQGVSVMIYDQTCAAELRRKRKRGTAPTPDTRILINERVCEGCGDCGKVSNCLSLLPVETDYGRKRQIDQHSCNMDYSCVEGFCPSFVTVKGGSLRKPDPAALTHNHEERFKDMPLPSLPELTRPMALLVNGIGGTGVVTIGAILVMAAHLENKGGRAVDQAGLAQKGGAVASHVRLGQTPDAIHTGRIDAAGADVILGCDLLVTADGPSLSTIRPDHTKVILNTHKTPTGEFAKNPEWDIPASNMTSAIGRLAGDHNLFAFDATHLATTLCGQSIATNMFMLGYAFQKGVIPISEEAIFKALELNGVSVAMNKNAFLWGRHTAWDFDTVMTLVAPKKESDVENRHRERSSSPETVIMRRVQSLTRYQNKAYAKKYEALIKQVRDADSAVAGKDGALTEAVARYYYKLMAYKDEYEVARLYTDGQFAAQLKKTFTGPVKIHLNLAPPLLARRGANGQPVKSEFGPWILTALKILSRFKFLRGTAFDVFGYTKERRTERALIKSYKKTIEDLLPKLNQDNYDTIVAIASIPEEIRGYGHVKMAHLMKAREKEKNLRTKI